MRGGIYVGKGWGWTKGVRHEFLHKLYMRDDALREERTEEGRRDTFGETICPRTDTGARGRSSVCWCVFCGILWNSVMVME